MESVTYFGRFILFMLLGANVASKNLPSIPDTTEWNILMRDAKPSKPDAYLCTAYPVEYDEAYIYKFEALAKASTAHHMLLYGCDGPEYPHRSPIWQCPAMCKGHSQTIMFAWAKNAPPTVFPKDVGLKIGKQSRIKTIVLQIHYARAFPSNSEPDKSGLKMYITKQRQRFSAGILLMMSSFFQVPPHKSAYPVDMSCQYNKPNSMFPFAYRTHSHGLGKVITGYQYNGSYHLIGKGNPQWPQAFYPVKTKVEVKRGDFLAGRCTYDSSKTRKITYVGATGNDEMCNFYIMYYTDSSASDEPYECYSNEYEQLTGKHFPADVSVPLPHNATLEDEAAGHHHHHGHPQPATTETHVIQKPQDHGKSEVSHLSPLEQQSNNDDHMKQMHPNEHVSNYVKNGEHFQTLPDEGERETQKSKTQDYETLQQQKFQQNEKVNNGHFPNYDYDNINPRDISHKHGMNREYYDDYAANDWREQNRYGDSDSDVELSRNRNKEFDAMNKQLQQQFSRNETPKNSRPQPQPQPQRQHQRGSATNRGQHSRVAVGQRNPQDRSPASKTATQMGRPNGADKLVEIPHSNIHIEKKLTYQPSWPAEALDIGQVGGVSADKDGNVYIFHRASRIWDVHSFDFMDNFRYQDAPIEGDVVLVLDKNGKFVRKFGEGQFFMPHGITVDLEGNIWLTDVALHQVFKIPKDGTVPIKTFGHRFKHSEDLSYFCKPADVAILSTGEFFVADGYCNSRIMKFSKDGKLLKFWGKKNTYLNSNPEPLVFAVVHNLAVSEKDNLLCAADRENARIQCFDLDGNYKHIIKHKEFGTKLFALDYSPRHGGILYAVNGPSIDGHSNMPVQGFTMDMKNGALIDQWNLPQSFKKPHDMCVDPTSDSVYIGELDPRMVWKLTRMSDEEAKSVFTNLNLHDDDEEEEEVEEKKEHHDDKDTNIDQHKKEQKVVTASPTVSEKISSNHTNSSSVELNKMTERETGLSASMVMGLVLTVPVILLLIVVFVVRSYRSGNLKFFTSGGKGNKRIFNMQHILGNSHKGFDPLSTEESDHDLDPDDSDQEEYAAPKKTKN